ncbi:MAG: molybdenum cofactor cytidylyltransferase [Candidatus Frackibacter sp. T328-2]|nr:MAG: molybdenum cofactor cytidylyltransferase [Candidatus Frackibacter sp. T328-2]
MISTIVLAAGMSTRLGRAKQLLSIGETTVIERVIDKLLVAEVEEIIVVLGHEVDKIEALIENRNVKIVYNSDYQLGQSTSLIKGLHLIDDNCKGVLCMLSDQPLIKVETLNALIAKFESGEELIVYPEYNGQRGNPVIFSTKLKSEMLKASGDQGARGLLTKYQDKSTSIEVKDQGVVFDIDTEEDYQELLELIGY